MDNFTTEKLEVPIHDIHPNPFNPNFQDKATFEKEKKSIQELGMLGSILVREHIIPGHYEILDGEHRWKAAVELGYTKMQVESLGSVSDQQMKFLTIHLNNLRGKDDVFKRAAILQELDAGQLEMLPWTNQEIENEKQLLSFDFAQYDKESDLPERTPGLLIVLPMNEQESLVWLKAKQELVNRQIIGTDNSKKKQDIQMVMWLIKQALGVLIGGNGSDIVEIEITREAQQEVQQNKVQIG